MTVNLADQTVTPLLIVAGSSANPFEAITAATLDSLTDTQIVTITFGSVYGLTSPGTLSDPNGGGSFVGSTFTESGLVGGNPTFATSLLKRLVYAAPALPAGQSYDLPVTITVNDYSNGVLVSSAADTTFNIDLLTAPALTGAVLDQPVASGGTIHPFASTTVTDYDFSYTAQDSATITITDGGGPTDADGLLTGGGLSKTGIGTYTISGGSYYELQDELQALTFTTVVIAAGQANRTPTFALTVTDSRASLSSKANDSTLIIAPPAQPTPPNITGMQPSQTVSSGSSINLFRNVTVSDENASPQESATITLTDANGVLTDPGSGGGFDAAAGAFLNHTATGVYSIASTTPTQLTAELDQLAFTPSSAEPTTNFTLSVNNSDSLTASATTTVSVQSAAPASGIFFVQDSTTQTSNFSNGETYSGPVSGLTTELVLPTTDQINITSEAPNTFIQIGELGQDNPTIAGINVSAANGDNVLDSYANSSFFTDGIGVDQNYLDFRAPTQNAWDTILNFHSGDNVTLWGLTAADFTLQWIGDTQGAAGSTGLTGVYVPKSGGPLAAFTLAGFTNADATNGKLTVGFNTIGSVPYASIHAN